MEIIPIGSTKIKISLTKNDLEKYSLDTSDIDYSNTETRKAFWSILDDAKHSTGFDAAKSKVLVQIFTSPSGGCEMFVTGVGLPEDNTVCCVKDPVIKDCERTYAFSCLEDLIGACKSLENIGYFSESHAYYCRDKYFLTVICPQGEDERNSFCISYSDILCEFGEAVSSAEYSLITEHAICFCRENAVKTLSSIG